LHGAHQREIFIGAAVDANCNSRRREGEVAQRALDSCPRFVLPRRGNRVLEIEDHLVGANGRGAGEFAVVVAGDRQA
jgi:hypothetical protein